MEGRGGERGGFGGGGSDFSFPPSICGNKGSSYLSPVPAFDFFIACTSVIVGGQRFCFASINRSMPVIFPSFEGERAGEYTLHVFLPTVGLERA